RDFQIIGVAVDETPTPAVPDWGKRNRIEFPLGWVDKDSFFRYTDLPNNTRPFVPILLFVDKDFEVNRQYAHGHPFFTSGEERKAAGIVNMLALTAPGKAKDLPRTQTAPQPAAAPANPQPAGKK